MTRCPQAVLRVEIESQAARQHGYSGDCLPPSWFDKSPEKDFRRQIDEMLGVIDLAERVYGQVFASPASFFDGWMDAHQQIQQECEGRAWPPLLASFGSSLVERAILDAICRMAGVSFAQAVRLNLFAIEPSRVISDLVGLAPSDWLPREPCEAIYVRHTVGLADPLSAADIPEGERLSDGFPQALEVYVADCGLRYFKIKVSNQLDRDIRRLRQIAGIVERFRGDDYAVTLDGNEQYRSAEEFDALIEAIRLEPCLSTLWRNVLVIEQPLERSIALCAEHTSGIRGLSATKPVIIDESDGTLHAYQQAVELGYRGVSSKSCKGALKSLLNAGLTWLNNDRGRREDFVMTGEDLCTVGIVPVQSDLCLVAALGLKHVERNGHHYHPGLSYLPPALQAAALAAHGDLYRQHGDTVAPRLVDGQFQIASLQCTGFGFAVEPDLEQMQSVEQWDFASLGLGQ